MKLYLIVNYDIFMEFRNYIRMIYIRSFQLILTVFTSFTESINFTLKYRIIIIDF